MNVVEHIMIIVTSFNQMVLVMSPRSRIALINAAGLIALVGFTALVYLRTQEPLILLIGGLVSVVSVIGATMNKSA
jgi:hypothetical protein